MANERCGCAKGLNHQRCRDFAAGLIFFRGKHRSRMDAARAILADKLWRGAVVRHEGSMLIATKGTAEMRLNAGVVEADAPAHVPVSIVSTMHGKPIRDLVAEGTQAMERAAADFESRERMAQKWNPPKDDYERSSAWDERTVICRNPLLAVSP